MAKIGLGITTKDRPHYLVKCLESLKGFNEFTCIVNDGDPYDNQIYDRFAGSVIQHKKNLGVACAKNTALRTLIQNGCDLLFLMEDDVLVKDLTVFSRYIAAGMASGIWHMNCGYTNGCNYDAEKKSHVYRDSVEYDGGNTVVFTSDLDDGFQFFHSGLIQMTGYMDERYSKYCSMEHVDHSYKMVKAGLIPAYWWWPDIYQSWKYIESIPESLDAKNSSIRSMPNYDDNFKKACSLFMAKHGKSPLGMPDTSKEDILKVLESINKQFSIDHRPQLSAVSGG